MEAFDVRYVDVLMRRQRKIWAEHAFSTISSWTYLRYPRALAPSSPWPGFFHVVRL